MSGVPELPPPGHPAWRPAALGDVRVSREALGLEPAGAARVSVPPRPNGFWHRRCPKNGLVVYSHRGKALLWTGGRVPANGPVLWWAMAACAAAGAAGALAGRSVG